MIARPMANVARAKAKKVHVQARHVKIANDAATAAKKEEQDAARVATEREADSTKILTISQLPDPTPVLNTEENNDDYLTYSDKKDEDNGFVASKVILSSEASADSASKWSKETDQNVRKFPKGEAVRSVKGQDTVSMT